MPEGPGPFPAAILISGSGPQDRDETLFEHKPFLVLADALTRRGIAVLRVDDRGVGGSTGSTAKSTSDDFAGDVLAGRRLPQDPQRDRQEAHRPDRPQRGRDHRAHGRRAVDPSRLHRPDGRHGTARRGDPLPPGPAHHEGQRRRGGGPEAAARAPEDAASPSSRPRRTRRPLPNEDAATSAKAIVDDAPGGPSARRSATRRASIEGQFKMVRSPWFRYFLTYDPRPTLAQGPLPGPGARRREGPPGPAEGEPLRRSRRPSRPAATAASTVKELPGLNHLFQTCKTGAPAEYAQIEETLAPSALEHDRRLGRRASQSAMMSPSDRKPALAAPSSHATVAACSSVTFSLRMLVDPQS